MAFTITVHEKDAYMYQLISDRLRSHFSDAYICRDTDDPDSDNISEYTIDLIDNSRLARHGGRMTGDISDLYSNPVPIYTFKDGTKVADMKKVEEEIMNIRSYMSRVGNTSCTGSGSKSPVSFSYGGRLVLVLPFTYADEREDYIRDTFDDLRDADSMCIRIDLMSGARMPSSFRADLTGGSLTTLLRRVGSASFSPEDILEYLNPDSMGYLTPGMPDLNDDVYDIGIESSVSLLHKLKALVCDTSGSFNALVVVEGFRLEDLKKLVGVSDELHVLLPADKCNKEGFERFSRALKQNLMPDAGFIVHRTGNRMESTAK